MWREKSMGPMMDYLCYMKSFWRSMVDSQCSMWTASAPGWAVRAPGILWCCSKMDCWVSSWTIGAPTWTALALGRTASAPGWTTSAPWCTANAPCWTGSLREWCRTPWCPLPPDPQSPSPATRITKSIFIPGENFSESLRLSSLLSWYWQYFRNNFHRKS